MSVPSPHYEYAVEQDWAGWWRSFGYDGHLEARLNRRAQDGWRLVSTKIAYRWCWYIIPRPKLLLFFERVAG